MSVADFPISGDSFPWLVFFGLIVGGLGGFFGTGGGYLVVPMLNVVFGVPYNMAVGSVLSQMCSMSTAATGRHMRFGNIDVKLALLMIVGSVLGIEAGAAILEVFEHSGAVVITHRPVNLMTLVMSLVYAALLFFLGTAMIRESRNTLKRTAGRVGLPVAEAPASPIVLRLPTLKL